MKYEIGTVFIGTGIQSSVKKATPEAVRSWKFEVGRKGWPYKVIGNSELVIKFMSYMSI